MTHSVISHRVLVLNQDYQALSICNIERAFLLIFLKKAELVVEDETRELRTVNKSFKFPCVIRLYRYVNMPYQKVTLTRLNIFRRDGNQCMYCGAKTNLTIDHVIPKSQGGKDTWENLVTACQDCNSRKGDRTPEESGMQLLRKPFRPSYIMFLSKYNSYTPEAWLPYLMNV